MNEPSTCTCGRLRELTADYDPRCPEHRGQARPLPPARCAQDLLAELLKLREREESVFLRGPTAAEWADVWARAKQACERGGWTPIDQFDYAQPGGRLRWMIATRDHVIGDCFWGRGPHFAGPELNDEPHIEAWRYTTDGRRVPEHLKPEFFQALPGSVQAHERRMEHLLAGDLRIA